MNFPTLKNFNELLQTRGTETTKSYIDKIENIKYLMYMLSFSYSHCDKINRINYTVNKQFNSKPTNLDEFIKITDETQAKLLEMLRQSVKEHKSEWNCILPDKNEDEIMHDITNIRVLMSDEILTKWYNETENPTIVNALLDFILENSAKRKNNSLYEITIYDFNNYSVCFETEEDLDNFVEKFVECGTAGVIVYDGPEDTAGSWHELYSI